MKIFETVRKIIKLTKILRNYRSHNVKIIANTYKKDKLSIHMNKSIVKPASGRHKYILRKRNDDTRDGREGGT